MLLLNHVYQINSDRYWHGSSLKHAITRKHEKRTLWNRHKIDLSVTYQQWNSKNVNKGVICVKVQIVYDCYELLCKKEVKTRPNVIYN